MKTRIHVNQHVIKANKKHGTNEPVVSIKRGRKNTYTNCARIVDAAGVEVARVVYSPDKPLDCGARVWIETHLTVIAEPVIIKQSLTERGEHA